MADFAASCAATDPANAEDLREPEKFTFPAEAQPMTFPEGSVIETIVLLKVALTCATPLGTVRVIFFLDLAGAFLTIGGFFAAFESFAKTFTPY